MINIFTIGKLSLQIISFAKLLIAVPYCFFLHIILPDLTFFARLLIVVPDHFFAKLLIVVLDHLFEQIVHIVIPGHLMQILQICVWGYFFFKISSTCIWQNL